MMTRKVIGMAVALSLGVAGSAMAQNNGQIAPAPHMTGNPDTAPTMSPSSSQNQNPTVNPNAAGTQLARPSAGGAGAPTGPAGTPTVAPGAPNGGPRAATTPGPTPAAVPPAADQTPIAGTNTALSPGANSFTQAQARRRIESRGYTQVSQLHKDSTSIWRAMAMKNGQQVHVGLDYRGTVAQEP